MTSRHIPKATALGLAMLVTLGTLSGLDRLALTQATTPEAAAQQMAATPATQQVVVVGKRAARG
ncbi:MAG: hypothetical protein HY855_25605 [Burkholderiales bacterium]|nr:hypothetical protein [Burkholderiales bacterium]